MRPVWTQRAIAPTSWFWTYQGRKGHINMNDVDNFIKILVLRIGAKTAWGKNEISEQILLAKIQFLEDKITRTTS